MPMADDDNPNTLLESLVKLTGQVAGGTLDLARNTATLTAMFGETWARNTLMNRLEPERLEAMAEAGRFLREARELAGLSIKELADSLDMSDRQVLEEIESGRSIMPLELMLRSAALLARHDPIPFMIKFMRTYNPALEKTLEQWGVLALPRQYERERRFVNLVRQHDVLRTLSDDEYERFIHYMESSSSLVLDVMLKEKEVNAPAGKSAESKAKGKARPKSKSKSKVKAKVKATPRPRSSR
jgi:transcriptional regulator with XRE-family HTH domain